MSQLFRTELVESFGDKPFAELVKHYMETEKAPTQSYLKLASALPEGSERIADKFIGRWIEDALKPQFWKRATSEVCREIVENARGLCQTHSISFDNNDLSNMLGIVVLNFASIAQEQPRIREHMGIRASGFPWQSSLALLLPVVATYQMSTKTPAGAVMLLGSGLANLGYLLFGAGLVSGTFLAFKLTDRKQVFIAAVIAFVVGTVLVNVGA